MNRRFACSMVTASAVAFVVTAYLAAGDDGAQWVDAVPASSVWNAWPTTLAVILVEFPDVTHEGFYDGSGNGVEFRTIHTWRDFWNMLASDGYYVTPDPDDQRSQPCPPGREPVFGSLREYCIVSQLALLDARFPAGTVLGTGLTSKSSRPYSHL